MKGILFIFSVFCFLSGYTQDLRDDFARANALYSEGKFSEAAEIYNNISQENIHSADLHYNLGNAYYRMGEFAPAILHYEKAIKYNPGMEDARFNLKLARTKTADKSTVPDQPGFVAGWKSLVAAKTPDGWTLLSIQLLVLALVAFAFYRLSRSRGRKKAGFYSGIFLSFLFLFTTMVALRRQSDFYGKKEAIVMEPSVTVVSAPGEGGARLFVIHEGLKISISSETEGWMEIRLPNGDKGWIRNSEAAVI